jgi:hypothetical protein
LVRQAETTDFSITGRGVEHLEKNLSANPVLHELVKATEMGDSERIATRLAVHNTA